MSFSLYFFDILASSIYKTLVALSDWKTFLVSVNYAFDVLIKHHILRPVLRRKITFVAFCLLPWMIKPVRGLLLKK